MKYYGIYDTNEKSPTYGQMLNVARVQAPPEPLVSEYWDKQNKGWVFKPGILGKVMGLEDGGDYKEITEAKALEFAR